MKSLLTNLAPEEGLSELLKEMEEKVSLVFNKHSDFLEEEKNNHPVGSHLMKKED